MHAICKDFRWGSGERCSCLGNRSSRQDSHPSSAATDLRPLLLSAPLSVGSSHPSPPSPNPASSGKSPFLSWCHCPPAGSASRTGPGPRLAGSRALMGPASSMLCHHLHARAGRLREQAASADRRQHDGLTGRFGNYQQLTRQPQHLLWGLDHR